MTRYSLRRIRLVHFHNLVDEVIEVREGGHLFLLGDNGCGKTTVLDAIHLVLTGTLDIELNAAARIAGGREAGRSLQGVVLRYDAERGVVNEGGAITYALLELASDEGEALTIGVGIEATTMEADIHRWGVIHRGELDSIPIVVERAEGRVPASRDELRAALGKLAVPAKMTEFRREIATRLFGGPSLYEEVCRFWSMAKAYREIVARARDFSSLFVRLLPAPDPVVFADILSSLRALDELEGLIGELDRQRAYVSALSALNDEIRALREEIARYRWLGTFLRRADAVSRRSELAARVTSSRQELDKAVARLSASRGALEVAREALRAADARDPDRLIERLRSTEAELAKALGECQSHAAELAAARREASASEFTAERAHARRNALWASKVDALASRAEAARGLEHALVELDRLIEAERAALSLPLADAAPPLGEIAVSAIEEAEHLTRSSEAAAKEAESRSARAERDHELRRAELAHLESFGEEQPAVAGFAEARDALAAAGIDAEPLFQALEPLPSTGEAELSALEALLGDSALAAFVVAPDDLEAARAIALPHAGVRVVVRAAPDATLPSWVADLFGSAIGSEPLAALATLLSQPASLGEPKAPDALGDVEHRGLVVRATSQRPRLLGARARRRAHEKRLGEARDALAGAERALDKCRKTERTAQALFDRARAVETALEELRARPLLEAQSALELSLVERGHARRRARDIETLSERSEATRAQAESLAAALRAKLHAEGLEEIERRLDELRTKEQAASDDYARAESARAKVEAALEQLEAAETEEARRVEELSAELSERSAALRSALEVSAGPSSLDDEALERYVRVDRRGDQFRSLQNLEERLRGAENEEAAACREIDGDGSRGTRNLEWAGRFGFSWSRADLRVEDRRGEALAGVLTRIERDLAEQREVVNDKTRELMDRLVMGDLARELQEQVERLYRMVREMNQLLADLRFGTTRYQFKVVPKGDVSELIGVVRRLSLLDDASRAQFRELIDARLEDVRRTDAGDVPELLDYRRWFDYRLSMRSTNSDDTELTRELRSLGSGGEQGVPNYLLVLALAKLMFDNAAARTRPLLFDEAFYGIDAGRRDQLLRFATELGLQLVVASPDQDGVTPSATRTTTLFLVKDENADVHLAPYHYWNDTRSAQPELFRERALEAEPADALCVVGRSDDA